MLTREEAKIKIANIIKNSSPVQTGASLGTIRPGEKFNVYNVNIDYLVPNVLNDRIAMIAREFEAENGRQLSFNNENDIEFVFGTIERENIKANEKTLKDLAKKGQEEYGVITNDGIVISGNRRTTLLRKLWKGEAIKYGQNPENFKYLKCIILDDTFDQKEIAAFETLTQLGKDKQLDYNRINLYIKVDNLFSHGYNYQQIANYMSAMSAKDIKDMHELYKFMCDYLDKIDKPNRFTLLDGLEDQMINTCAFFRKLDNKTYEANWDYTDMDVSNFKLVCYDYLRSHYEGKEYRDVLLGKVNKNKANGVFTDKKVWENFYNRHNQIMDSHLDKLKNENDWKLLGKSSFTTSLKSAERELEDVVQAKNTKDLIKTIDNKLNSLETLLVDIDSLDEDEYGLLKDINKRIYEILKDYK